MATDLTDTLFDRAERAIADAIATRAKVKVGLVAARLRSASRTRRPSSPAIPADAYGSVK